MTDEPWLEVHILGSSYKGECVILRLPGGKYGIIDCCCHRGPSEVATNPALQFIKERKIDRLAFACLTHPHEDHYYGLSYVLEAAPPDEFWTPAAMQRETLIDIVLAETVTAKRESNAGGEKRANELKRLYEIWNKLKQEDRTRKLRLATGSTRLFPFPEHANPAATISSFSPNASEIESYHTSLRSCFKDGRPKPQAPSLPHNKISIGLIVESSKFALILGGDVENNNWNDAVHDMNESRWKNARLVKISHHGSKTGHNSDLWELLAGCNNLLAISTGFRSSQLPEADVLDRVLEAGSDLFCTHRESVPSGFLQSAERAVHAESMKALSAAFGPDPRLAELASVIDDVEALGEPKHGRCSFYFSKHGEVRWELHGGACHIRKGRQR